MPNRWWLSSWPNDLSASVPGKNRGQSKNRLQALVKRLVATSYSIIYVPIPQSSTFAVRNRAASCARGSGGPASRDAWSGHSTTSHSGSTAAFVSNLAPSYLPSIHVSQCPPPACVPAAASQCRQVWMAVAERAERVPCGPQETVKTCRTRTDDVLFLVGLIRADFYPNVSFSSKTTKSALGCLSYIYP